MTQHDPKVLELHPALAPVLRLELARARLYGQPIAPLGPEYYMYLAELNRSTRIVVDGTPPGVTC